MDEKIKIMLVLIFLLVLLLSSIALASTLTYYGRIVGTVTILKP
jgi:hypothetical protein